MRLRLLAVGKRMPRWVEDGVTDYARRLPPDLRLELTEIPPGRRTGNQSPDRAIGQEGKRMQALIPAAATVVALDEGGTCWSSTELAHQLQAWRTRGNDTCLLVGGPDGLAPACMAQADSAWSLSRLTLPHALVRVLVVEQLYRAWSILGNHPYHRG